MTISFDDAKKILSVCERFENRDHYFGDREVYWVLQGEEVAEGYFGSHDSNVWIELPEEASFEGEEARELVKCGAVVHIGRNDETGDDHYWGA